MAKLLQQLLQDSSHSLHYSVEKLERYSGQAGRDVRLAAEIIGKSHLALKSLDLDPRDSLGSEVYAALTTLFKLHDSFLRKHIGIDSTATREVAVKHTITFTQKLSMPRRVWAIKTKVIKDILLERPPKRTMKALGYRSIHSMVKREQVAHVLFAARHLEGKTWLHFLNSSYVRLEPQDFEERDIAICAPQSRHWKEHAPLFAKELGSYIACIPELGSIVILPHTHKQTDGITLATFLILLECYAELRMYSSCFRLHRFSDSFGKKIINIISHDLHLRDDTTNALHDWRLLHAYYAGVDSEHHPEYFYPHVTIEDLSLRKNEDVLMSIEPAFGFWKDMEFVGALFRDSQIPVSFNILDVAISTVDKATFNQRSVQFMQAGLWDEILLRYMDSHHVRSHVLRALSGVTSRQEKDFVLV